MRDRSRSPERDISLPDGVSPISESDYFLKNTEFRVWLRDEKNKYFDELSSERARRWARTGHPIVTAQLMRGNDSFSYFRKFVRAWNKGRLSKVLYHDAAAIAGSATNQTAYKWSFASKASNADVNALRAAREEVGSATYRPSGDDGGHRQSTSSGRVIGPALPSASDLVLAREAISEQQASERDFKRKRDRAEAKERLEDVVGPKEVGREGMLEKKRTRRENDRAFREKGDEGYEVDESTLLGGGDGFRDHIARRDAARKRFEEKRTAAREDKTSTARERVAAMREKDKVTMDMFQQLAKQRFG